MIEAVGGFRVLDINQAVREGVPGEVDLVVLPILADERPLRGLASVVDWNARGALTRLLDARFTDGSAGDSVLTPAPLPGFSRLVLIGLGTTAEFERAPSDAAARVVRVTRGLMPGSLACDVPSGRVAAGACDEFTLGLVRGLTDVARDSWLVVGPEAITRTHRLISGPLRATEQAS